ncbi:MAG: hypothetical protein JKY33_10405 [Bacteroidia bacterium]|nr:hypothetical protein [Bacteroidia bacterium]
MIDLLKRFEKKYGRLKKKGLIIDELTGIKSGKMFTVINVSRPFMFDNRLIPAKFEGVEIKRKIYGTLPSEFKINKKDSEQNGYIWAAERFEQYVDNHAEEIKIQLDNPDMSREEMLDALCFGNFEKHQQKCARWVEEGKIPAFNENQ